MQATLSVLDRWRLPALGLGMPVNVLLLLPVAKLFLGEDDDDANIALPEALAACVAALVLALRSPPGCGGGKKGM